MKNTEVEKLVKLKSYLNQGCNNMESEKKFSAQISEFQRVRKKKKTIFYKLRTFSNSSAKISKDFQLKGKSLKIKSIEA